jgi:hypothetical protein
MIMEVFPVKNEKMPSLAKGIEPLVEALFVFVTLM